MISFEECSVFSILREILWGIRILNIHESRLVTHFFIHKWKAYRLQSDRKILLLKMTSYRFTRAKAENSPKKKKKNIFEQEAFVYVNRMFNATNAETAFFLIPMQIDRGSSC